MGIAYYEWPEDQITVKIYFAFSSTNKNITCVVGKDLPQRPNFPVMHDLVALV